MLMGIMLCIMASISSDDVGCSRPTREPRRSACSNISASTSSWTRWRRFRTMFSCNSRRCEAGGQRCGYWMNVRDSSIECGSGRGRGKSGSSPARSSSAVGSLRPMSSSHLASNSCWVSSESDHDVWSCWYTVPMELVGDGARRTGVAYSVG